MVCSDATVPLVMLVEIMGLLQAKQAMGNMYCTYISNSYMLNIVTVIR